MSGAVAVGFYGKLPARGDFVRVGPPRRFTDPWDEWLLAVLAGSRSHLGEGFVPAWLEAPVWRFALASGICGPDAVLGLWMPSVDRTGRHFPLTIARAGPAVAIAADSGAFLAVAEQAGVVAISEDLGPEDLLTQLRAGGVSCGVELGPFPETGGVWWTDGAPRVAPARFAADGLPDAARFASMIDDGSV